MRRNVYMSTAFNDHKDSRPIRRGILGAALPACLGSLNLVRRRPGAFPGTGVRYSKTYRLISREEVRPIKKKEGTGIKRVNINVEVNLHNAFKAATAAQGVDMTTVLLEFIENYVAQHGSVTPHKKGRRG
jgi:ParG protein